MQHIDINKIIDEIRQEIKDRGYTSDLLSFEDSCAADGINLEVQLNLAYLTRSKAEIEEYPRWESGSITTKIKVVIKKIFRKCMKFYIVPIVENQNQFNILAADRIVDYCKVMQQKEEALLSLTKRISELEKKYKGLEEQMQRGKE